MKTKPSSLNVLLSFLALSLLAAGLAGAEATVPDGINYQGLLTDAGGNPVKPDGTYTLEFRLWSDPDAEGTSALVWGRQFEVIVVSGQFNVILNDGGPDNVLTGAPETKLIDAFAAPKRYLGITITNAPATVQEGEQEGETTGKTTTVTGEIKPRQAILSTPYAIQSVEATHALEADDSLEADQAHYAQSLNSPHEVWSAQRIADFPLPAEKTTVVTLQITKNLIDPNDTDKGYRSIFVGVTGTVSKDYDTARVSCDLWLERDGEELRAPVKLTTALATGFPLSFPIDLWTIDDSNTGSTVTYELKARCEGGIQNLKYIKLWAYEIGV